MIAALIGGIGLFLLGMVLLTDSLKLVAGDALRRILGRFVGGPVSGMASGAIVTAIVQSSSAVTLTTIGFVSAGLLTFTQATGVIFGANLGTTSTAWIVSLLGFKLDLGLVTQPMIGVGVLMRLMLRGPWAHAGMAMAGFGLIFVGIDQLQDGMAGLAENIDPSRLPRDTFTGRLLLLMIGIVMTIVMQSSSAAVATTLAALNAGSINMEQAAALVIGQNAGATAKVMLVAIGASTAVKRTALAHVLFNVITATFAFVLVGPCVRIIGWMMHHWEPTPGVLTLAAFYTSFNLAGVIVFLPWLTRFAAMIERIIPQRGPMLTRHLEKALTADPQMAIDAAMRSMRAIAREMFAVMHLRLTASGHAPIEEQLERIDQALAQVREYLGQIKTPQAEPGAEYPRHLAMLHALDHLDELVGKCGIAEHQGWITRDGRLKQLALTLAQAANDSLPWLAGEEGARPGAGAIGRMSQSLAQSRRELRPLILAESARGALSADGALQRLDALAWIDSLGYHAWRAIHHLSMTPDESGAVPHEPAAA